MATKTENHRCLSGFLQLVLVAGTLTPPPAWRDGKGSYLHLDRSTTAGKAQQKMLDAINLG